MMKQIGEYMYNRAQQQHTPFNEQRLVQISPLAVWCLQKHLFCLSGSYIVTENKTPTSQITRYKQDDD